MNIRGLVHNLADFTQTIENEQPLVAVVTETKLYKDIPTPFINGYSTFRRDRPSSRWGGVAVYYRSDMNARRLSHLESDDCEFICLSISIKGFVLYLCAVYWPPDSNIDYCDCLDNVMHSIAFSYESAFVVAGDFNAHHVSWPYCARSNTHGQLIQDFLGQNNLYQLVTKPTRSEGASTSCLDFFITNMPSCFTFVDVHAPIGASDHGTVVVDCLPNLDSITAGSDPPFIPRMLFNCHKIDWVSLNDAFDGVDWDSLFLARDIDTCWNSFKRLYFLLLANHAGRLKRPRGHFKDFILSNYTLDWKRKKNSAWRRHLTLRSDDSYNVYRITRNVYSHCVRSEQQAHADRTVNSIINANSPKKWHNLCKSLYLGASISASIPTLHSGDRVCSTDQDKCNLFSSVFGGGQSSNTDCIFPSPDLRTEAIISDIVVTPELVFSQLSSIDISKSTGPDCVQNSVLRNCARSLCYPLSVLFRKSLDIGRLPEDWKTAQITPVFKDKGSRSDPARYRPVSLTSNIVKVLERLINTELLRHLCDNDLISKSQFGFLPKHSTTDQLCYLMHDLMGALEKKQHAAAVFLDIEAAFDTVPHAAIRQKLPAYGIRGKLFRWICDYISMRRQAVRIGDCCSEYTRVISGVPQGSVIAPTIFIVFINDICDQINLPLSSNTTPCDSLIYADDTMLYCTSVDINAVIDSLNDSLRTIESWSSRWKMKFSASKTHAIFFSRSRVDNPSRSLRFCDADISFVSSHRHLGFTITSDLSYNAHVEGICRKVGTQLFLLKQLRLKTSNRDILTRVYKTYIRPYFEYATPAWSALPFYLCEKLEKLQRRAIRVILGYAYRRPLDASDYRLLGLTKLISRRNLALCCYGYKLYSGLLPRAFDYLRPITSPRIITTRQQDYLRLPCINTARTSRFFDRSPIIFALKLLNALPSSTLGGSDVDLFKSLIWTNHFNYICELTF